MTLKGEERQDLLFDLSQMGSSGRAEEEREQTFKRTYFPVPEHIRAFDPSVALVLEHAAPVRASFFVQPLRRISCPQLSEQPGRHAAFASRRKLTG